MPVDLPMLRKTASTPYLTGGLDTIDVLRAKLDRNQFEGFCAGQAERRLHRGLTSSSNGDWNAALRDWETSKWYLDQLLTATQDRTDRPDRPDRTERSDRPVQALPPRRPVAASNPRPTPTSLEDGITDYYGMSNNQLTR